MLKIIAAIDNIAPFKTEYLKGNSYEWLSGEYIVSIAIRFKLCKKLKWNHLHVE